MNQEEGHIHDTPHEDSLRSLSPEARIRKHYWVVDLKQGIPVLNKVGNPTLHCFNRQSDMNRYLESHPESIEVDSPNARRMGGHTSWHPKFIHDLASELLNDLKQKKSELKQQGYRHFLATLKVQFGSAEASYKVSRDRFPAVDLLALVAHCLNHSTSPVETNSQVLFTINLMASAGVITPEGKSKRAEYPIVTFPLLHQLSLSEFHIRNWYNQNRFTGEIIM
jgi:hypothetical protein